jgi:hypothetical protein
VFQDVCSPHLVVEEVEAEVRFALGLDVELPLKPDSCGVPRPTANLLSLASLEAPRTRVPSLSRSYPASSVSGRRRRPPGAGLRPPLKRPVRFSRRPLSQGMRPWTLKRGDHGNKALQSELAA